MSILESIVDQGAGVTNDQFSVPSLPEPPLLEFRRAEFNILRTALDDRRISPDLRVIEGVVPDMFKSWFERVNLIERLKETRAFFGFDRLMQNRNPLERMPEQAFEQLFKDAPVDRLKTWLPAIEVFGEGIYFELDERKIRKWQNARLS